MQNKQEVIHDLSQNPSISYHLIKQIINFLKIVSQNIEELVNSMCKAV